MNLFHISSLNRNLQTQINKEQKIHERFRQSLRKVKGVKEIDKLKMYSEILQIEKVNTELESMTKG